MSKAGTRAGLGFAVKLPRKLRRALCSRRREKKACKALSKSLGYPILQSGPLERRNRNDQRRTESASQGSARTRASLRDPADDADDRPHRKPSIGGYLWRPAA